MTDPRLAPLPLKLKIIHKIAYLGSMAFVMLTVPNFALAQTIPESGISPNLQKIAERLLAKEEPKIGIESKNVTMTEGRRFPANAAELAEFAFNKSKIFEQPDSMVRFARACDFINALNGDRTSKSEKKVKSCQQTLE